MKTFEEHIKNLKLDFAIKISLLDEYGRFPTFEENSNNYCIALMIYEMIKFELKDKNTLIKMENKLKEKLNNE